VIFDGPDVGLLFAGAMEFSVAPPEGKVSDAVPFATLLDSLRAPV